MALAFYINGPDDIAHAFAAHDEYLAIFTHYYFRSRKGEEENVRALRPDVDDYYSAPYCYLSWKDGGSSRTRTDGGFLVFACMVPYLHGNPWTRENVEYQTMDNGTRAHHQAREWMKHKGTFKSRTPHVGTVEKFQTEMKLGYNDRGVYTFTADGGYPTWKDVSESLEDGAVGVICSAMKWKVPTHWRDVRKRIEDLHNIPILDLALWEKEKKQQLLQQQQQQPLLIQHSQQKDQEGDDVEEYDEESRSSSNSRIQQMDENETANLLLGLGGNSRHTTEYSNNDKYEYDDYNDNSNDDYDDIDGDYDEFYDDDDDDDTNDRATKIQRNEVEQQQQQSGWYNNSNSGGGGDDNNNKNVVHNDYEQEEEKKDYSSSNNNVRMTQV